MDYQVTDCNPQGNIVAALPPYYWPVGRGSPVTVCLLASVCYWPATPTTAAAASSGIVHNTE